MINNVTMNPGQAAGNAQAAGGNSGTEQFDFWSYLLGLQGNQNSLEDTLMGLTTENTEEGAKEEVTNLLSNADLGAINNALSGAMANLAPKAEFAPVKAEVISPLLQQQQQEVAPSHWYTTNLLAKAEVNQGKGDREEGDGEVGTATLAVQPQVEQSTTESAFDAAQAAALEKYRASAGDNNDSNDAPRVSKQDGPSLELTRKRGTGTGAQMQTGSLTEAITAQPGTSAAGSESVAGDPSAVNDVFQRIETMVHQGGGKMTVTLSPPELGSLEIQVTTRGKRVEIEMTSDNDAAKSVLESGLADLKQSLQAQDLVLSKTDVRVARDLAENPFGSLAGGGQSFQGQESQSRGDGRRSEGSRQFFQPANLSSLRTMSSDSKYTRSGTSGGVDIRI